MFITPAFGKLSGEAKHRRYRHDNINNKGPAIAWQALLVRKHVMVALRLDGLRLAGNTKMPARLIETGKDMAVAEEFNQP